MSTTKQALKVRLDPELYRHLHELHSGYGEASGIVTQLVTAYLEARKYYEYPQDTAISAAINRMKG